MHWDHIDCHDVRFGTEVSDRRDIPAHWLNSKHVILDLCGGTGAWSRPYVEAGYTVYNITLPEYDVRLWKGYLDMKVHGILAAPPCTVFSYARNRYEPTEEEFREALSIVDACLRIISFCNPEWWALENPRNKLRRWLGNPVWIFRQYEYADPACKPTCLWGNFSIPPLIPGMRKKPSTRKTSTANAKPKDAITPPGFAQAFFRANP